MVKIFKVYLAATYNIAKSTLWFLNLILFNILIDKLNNMMNCILTRFTDDTDLEGVIDMLQSRAATKKVQQDGRICLWILKKFSKGKW